MSGFKQDLFWGGMPKFGPWRHDKFGFLRPSTKNIIKPISLNRPYFIYTGTGHIKQLQNFVIRKKIKSYITDIGLDFYLYEPLSFKSIKKGYNCAYYSEFSHQENLKDFSVTELDSISEFAEKHQLDSIRVFTCDYNSQDLEKIYPNLKIKCFDLFLRKLQFKHHKKETEKIQKPFLCTTWRYTAHRHLMMSYLINYPGNYSWGFITDPILELNSYYPWLNILTFTKKILNRLNNGNHKLNSKDIYIDQKVSKTKIDIPTNLNYPGDLDPPPMSRILKDAYLNSFCAVVTETRFAYPFGNFSEKILNSIAFDTPFIVVGPPFTLKYLKKLGFKSFDRWWDESYDQEIDHQKRLLKIFDLVDFIGNKSLDELKQIHCEMQDILTYNKTILKKLPKNLLVF